jgi:vacuolar-type H+-ATPase subunit E/Vma4
MLTDIESFVKKLESEGVDAGKKAAEKIEAGAQSQADKIIADGKARAEQIIAEANAEAEKIKNRMNSSLELASRDAVYMLREKLIRQLKAILNRHVEQALRDEQTLTNVLREVIPVLAKADANRKLTAEINISDEIKSRLLESSLRELIYSLRNQNVEVDAKYNLAKAGFEFKIEGSTIEVSAESVTALLAEMVDPELREILEKATEQKN